MNVEEIKEQAIEYAKRNKLRIAWELTSKDIYKPSSIPISIFMAGSPGAGKTEFSKNLIKDLIKIRQSMQVIRIDNDEIRNLIPGYAGNNSHLFQGATSLIVEKMHDLALHNNQNFIFDSTFANYEKACDNIRRSLSKKRPVFIFYIYQDPEVAWKFTIAREKAEGRRIPRTAFIEEFINARETVNKIRIKFSENVSIFLVKKNFETNAVDDFIKIGGSIDEYIEKKYTRETLEKIL
ncbi:MAG: zeta toxin family protein [Patescibacteria group bacterium]